MSLTFRVFVALLIGLLFGIAVAASEHPFLLALAPLIEPIGTLWLNALRMTVIPLLIAIVITGIAAASEAATAGRLGLRTVGFIVVLLVGSALFGGFGSAAILQVFPLDPNTTALLQERMGGSSLTTTSVPSFGEWVTALVPSNVIQAAAEGAILPLLFFSLLFGVAAARLNDISRTQILGFFRALGDTMLLMVRWVLVAAPIGVFALVFPFGATMGLRTIGALAYYVILLAALCLVTTLALVPLVAIGARLPIARTVSAIFPAQVVAFSTRSSLASLPAMLEVARTKLGINAAVAGLTLPLAVTLMRLTSPLVNVARAVFVAELFQIHVSPIQILAAAAVGIATSLAAVGLPSEVNFMAVNIPIFQVLGVPLEPLALLIAVEAVPDMFMTVGNVTADLTVATLAAKGDVATEVVSDALIAADP